MLENLMGSVMAIRDSLMSRGVYNLPTSDRELWRRIRVGEEYEYDEIKPQPIIVDDPVQQEEAFRSGLKIQGQEKVYLVKGISKTDYLMSDLQSTEVDYIIGDFDSGLLCELQEITSKTLTWELRLKQKVSQQQYRLY